MTLSTRRYDPQVGVSDLGDLWSLTKNGEWLRARLWTHPDGWELRLYRGESELRRHVLDEHDRVMRYATRWRLNAESQGWKTPEPT
jgi:hypothetical protein